LPEHPAREQSKAAPPAAAASKFGAERRGRELPVPKETETQLVGIVSSETGRRAILSVGKRQVTLAVGEEKDDVTLVSLTEDTATISTPSGVRVLSMGARSLK
jgi:hypothetical protein